MTSIELPPENAVRAGALSNWDSLVSELGGDPAAIAAQAGLNLAALQHPDGYINYAVFERALAVAATTLDCSDFGLRLGATHDLSMLGPLGLLMAQCPSVLDALKLAPAYAGVHVRDELWQVEISAKLCTIVRYQQAVYLPDDRQTRELSLATVASLVRSLVGPDCIPQAVYFSHSAPASIKRYRKLLGSRPLFNADRDQLVFSTRSLLRKPRSPAQPTLDSIEAGLQKTLATLDNDIVRQTRWLLTCTHSDSQLTLPAIAAMLHTSPRTLQRKLQHANTDFRQLLLQTRMQAAARYLRNNRLSISQIATLVGYDNISAFSRAFSSHFDVAPRQYRQAMTKHNS